MGVVAPGEKKNVG